jgi:triacylglycerol esterase/lipase EstA (alpha/beta hydrolase family)
LPDQAADRTGVLFIHGFVCNRGLWNPWLRRLRERGTPFVALNLEPVFGSIDDYVKQIESAVTQLEHCTGQPIVIVAHSMGGLALRRWWTAHGIDARVRRAITIGTPHQGTWLARFAMSRNSRQMQQGSRWLQTLAAHESADRAKRFTCFYGHCDNIVFPASTATLAGADNRHLSGVAHVHMADRPEPWAELLRWLQAGASAPLRPPVC